MIINPAVIHRAPSNFKIMKKLIITTLPLLLSLLLLSGCSGLSERELAVHFNSRPPAATMPYDQPRYLPNAVPDQLPFSFRAYPNGDLLGTVEAGGQESGTILQKVNQSASEILEYYTQLLTEAAFTNTSESHSYQVFFPPEESGATFCGDQGAAVILEMFDFEDGSKDVRLHYSTDDAAIKRTTCGQPVLAIEDFPFPHLAAPPNASVMGGGGGGGGGGGAGTRPGPMGYMVSIEINSGDSLEFVNNHYVDLLTAEGWILLSQSSSEASIESNWDFGFYETRSWLARLITSVGDAPNQYLIRLLAISP